MNKKHAIKAALICAGIATLGYIVKKVHDLNAELDNLELGNLDEDTEDLFVCDQPKTQNEDRIFARHRFDNVETEVPLEVEEREVEEVEETTNEVTSKKDDENPTKTEDVEPRVEELPPEIINKIGKLEDLLTFEGLDFDVNQKKYLYFIIEYMKTHHDIRLALLIGLEYEGHHPLEVFTDNQFAEIKKIIQ